MKRTTLFVTVLAAVIAALSTGCGAQRVDGDNTLKNNVVSQTNDYFSSVSYDYDYDEDDYSSIDEEEEKEESSQNEESSKEEEASKNESSSKAEEDSKFVIDSVKGKTLDEAKDYFESKGLKYKVEEKYSDSVDEGKIISQTPEKGSDVKKGSEIIVVVSKGKEQKEEPPKEEAPAEEAAAPAQSSSNIVTVPDVVGKSLDDAANVISADGLYYTANFTFDSNVPKGQVISQEPGGGSEVSKGSRVTMIVSDGEEPQQEQVITYYEYSVTDGGSGGSGGSNNNTTTYDNGPKYVGTWTSFRPYINIECDDGVNYVINARWSGSAYNGICWKITATYNPVTDRLEYTNGKYYYYEISASGRESRTLRDGNTSGYLDRHSDSELYWYDSADSRMSNDPFKKR